MRKAFAAVGAIFGFIGLASFIIFSVETATTKNYGVPSGNLTADIAASAGAAPTGQLADIGVAGASTPDVPAVPQPEDQPSVASTTLATVATPVPPPTPVSTAAPAPPAVTTPPAPAIQPLAPIALTPPTSTEATATITVTPTAPTAPSTQTSSSPQATQQALPAGGLALPYNESTFAGDTNWQKVWGATATTFSGALDLSAGPASTGGAVYLKNAASWANYTMHATVDWLAGKAISLMADYNDASNYVVCEYAKTGPGTVTMQLAQYVGGNEILLAPATAASWDGVGTNINVSIGVSGVHGTCSFNGQSVSNDVVGPGMVAMSSAGSGSVGFSVSDPAANASEMIVKQVSVAGN